MTRRKILAALGAWALACGLAGCSQNVSWSPDSSQVALDIDGRLWVYDLGERNLSSLEGFGAGINPVWSPDGGKLLYYRHVPYANGKDRLHLLSYGAGGEEIVVSDIFPVAAMLVQLLEAPAELTIDGETQSHKKTLEEVRSELRLFLDATMSADWSPTGNLIAYNGGADTNPTIWITEPDGEAVRQLVKEPQIQLFPTWGPDGKRLAFLGAQPTSKEPMNWGPGSLYIVNADGSGIRRLWTAADGMGLKLAPSIQWSRDGQSIGIVTTPQSQADGDRDGTVEVWVVSPDSGEKSERWRLPSQFVALGPDLHHVVYVESITARRRGANLMIESWPPTGPRRLLKLDRPSRSDPVISPDGKAVAVMAFRRRGPWALHVVNLQGKKHRRVPIPGIQ